MSDWNQNYRETPNVFGADPAPILERHADLIDGETPILDVGCGQGRNSLFLARRGHEVLALDPSTVAVEQTGSTAEAEGLRITTQVGFMDDVHRPEGGFGAIMVFGLIPILTRAEINNMVASIERLIAPGGLLFITAFTTEDPKFTSGGQSAVYRHGTRTYLELGELRSLFSGWEVIEYWEGLGPEHRHGDGPVERHGLAEAVFRAP
jgi:tellurite methyltransferase